MTPPAQESEDRFLAWLRQQDPSLAERIGDDAAFLPPAKDRAVTMDSQIEGTHFVSGLPPEILARRLLAVNLSDLAAVGATPGSAFLALSAPTSFDRRRFFQAFLTACKRFGVELCGGDLATTDRITLTLTLFGKLGASGSWLRRDQGKAGHSLWVGGQLGESAVGRLLLGAGATAGPREEEAPRLPPELEIPNHLQEAAGQAIRRHLLPTPQIDLGQWLAGLPQPGAAIDLSDGLGKDLRRLCQASGVGALIDRRALTMTPALTQLASLLGRDSETLSVGGGEDYHLLFSLPPEVPEPEVKGCRHIGKLTGSPEVLWGREENWQELPNLGWDHLMTETEKAPHRS